MIGRFLIVGRRFGLARHEAPTPTPAHAGTVGESLSYPIPISLEYQGVTRKSMRASRTCPGPRQSCLNSVIRPRLRGGCVPTSMCFRFPPDARTYPAVVMVPIFRGLGGRNGALGTAESTIVRRAVPNGRLASVIRPLTARADTRAMLMRTARRQTGAQWGTPFGKETSWHRKADFSLCSPSPF